jgi:diadenosine tetraphosphate (Ap4A) HIT family hydrolase
MDRISNEVPYHREAASQEAYPWTRLIREDFHVSVFEDMFPVTEGHLLFVPRYNNMSSLMDAMSDAVECGKKGVESGQWDGFNVGLNYGTAAGQTCQWPHVHMIPRRHGDTVDPVGGVRNVIPGKGNYHKPGVPDLNSLIAGAYDHTHHDLPENKHE